MYVVIVSESAGLPENIRPVVLGAGLECAADDCVAFGSLPVRLARASTDLLLVVLDGEGKDALAAIDYATTHTPAPILVVGSSTSPHLILQAIRSGAREFLDNTRLREELAAALDKLHMAGTVVYRRGKAIAVTAATLGCGVTTVATSLAFAYAQEHARDVVLAELGSEVPELALDLDLLPQHPLAELARDWERLDAAMMRQALVQHPNGVSVLAHEPETLLPARMHPKAVRQTIVLLRAMFEYTILDLGHAADESALEAMKLTDPVVVVVRLDVPSLRLTRELLRQLTEHGIPAERLCVIVNRFGQRRQLHWKKAQEVLGVEIQDWIPDAPARLNEALNQGQPLVSTARWAAITRSFSKLASRLSARAA